MKDTASSCMIVATLIATVVFAAALTVPGGNKEDTGLPFFLHNVSFKIFAVSNVISLVASSDSIVNFLSIVMQMKISFVCCQQSFLLDLPHFSQQQQQCWRCSSATSYIVFVDGNLWTAILAIVVSFMPVILFVKQHLLFIKDVLRSTYATDYLIQEGKTSLFHKAEETTTMHQRKTKLFDFNGSNLTVPCTSLCSTNV